MKKRTNPLLFLCLFLTIFLLLICYSKNVNESVQFSISIWKDNLFPSLFPSFVISNLLIEYGFVDFLGILFGRWMPSLFGLKGEAGFVLFTSLISGFPSGAKYTARLVEEGVLSKEEGEHLLTFTHFANPLFILGFIGTSLLNQPRLAFLLLFCHIASNILIGLFGRKEKPSIEKRNWNQFFERKNPSFGSALSKSIKDALNTIFFLLGTITCFLILTTLMKSFLPLSDTAKLLISGILEMTQGIQYVSMSSFSELFKCLFILGFLSFGGFSVHLQVLSIITEQKLRYFPYFWARILQTLLSILLFLLLYPIVT